MLSGEEISGDFLVQPLWPKQGLPEPAAEEHMQSGFEWLLGWRFHSLSEKCVPLFNHSLKKCFSYVSGEFLVVQFMPIDSWPVTGSYWQSLALSSLYPAPSGIHPHWWSPPESSLLKELSQPLLEHMADVPSPLIIPVGCVITSGAGWSQGTVNPDRGIWRPIPAHPCQWGAWS